MRASTLRRRSVSRPTARTCATGSRRSHRREIRTTGALLKGFFIVLDGPDGSGKSTQALRTTSFLQEQGLRVVHVREPGGTAIGERIRSILLDPAHGAMCAQTETLLYLASRLQLVHEVIEPARAQGTTVVCERFIDATVAYQGAHGSIAADDIWAVWKRLAPGIEPDVAIFLDVDPVVGLGRIARDRDRMESLGSEFHRRVHDNYRRIAAENRERVVLIDAAGSPDRVQESIRGILRSRRIAPAPKDPVR